MESAEQGHTADQEAENGPLVTLALSELKELRQELACMKQAILDAKNDALITRAGVHELKSQRGAREAPVSVREHRRAVVEWRIQFAVFVAILSLHPFLMSYLEANRHSDGNITVRQQLETLLAENAQERLNSEELEVLIQDCRNASAILSREKMTLKEENDGLKEAVDYWMLEANRLKDSFADVTEKTAMLDNSLLELKKDSRRLESDILEVMNENLLLKQEIETKKNEKVRLENENIALENELLKLKLDYSDLELKEMKWEEEMESCRANVSSLKNQVNL